MYRIFYEKQAIKDIQNLKSAKLDKKAKEFVEIVRVNPFQSPPPYEALVGNLSGLFSRRLNIRHRFVYQVYFEKVVENGVVFEGTVKIIKMWSHYDGLNRLPRNKKGENLKFVEICVKIDAKPPFFIGSQVRGALGYALKWATCTNPTHDCQKCPLGKLRHMSEKQQTTEQKTTEQKTQEQKNKNICLYHELYEVKNQHKFRLRFTAGVPTYDFGVLLFEEATDHVPFVALALEQALKKRGLGRERRIFEEFEMCVKEPQIFSAGKFASSVFFEFLTPFRVKRESEFFFCGENLNLRGLLDSIYQRKTQILNGKFEKLPFEPKGQMAAKLHRIEMQRHSSRQKQTLDFGGFGGRGVVSGLDERSFELLKLGELVGVGRSCSFGMGNMRIKEL